MQQMDTTYRTPFLRNGLQVHLPYTVYASWFLLHRILSGAGVEKVQASIDLDSTSRAAFLCAYEDEVKRGDAHLFYVKFRKYLTVDERRRIVAQRKREMRALKKTLPEDIREDHKEVARQLMMLSLQQGHVHGQWADEWFDHPIANMGEPEKTMSWMTPNDDIPDSRKADMFLRAGLYHVDNVFQLSRRLMRGLERALATSGGKTAQWHGYAPYNPEMVQKYLTIFRVVHNFVSTGESKDGKTPAMRLGFVDRPLDLEDILWPGQRVPRRKRSRRKGRAITF